MKIWVTKYWETKGVLKRVASVSDDWATLENGEQLHGKDWHASSEEALADVVRRRTETVKALRKRIRKIQGMKL